MTTPATATAANLANRKKALIAGNIALWLFQGLYTVSPIDLIPDVLPLIGFADDLFGLMVTVAFTAYTLSILYKHGIKGLLPANEPEGEVIDITVADDSAIPGYEPLALDQIKAL